MADRDMTTPDSTAYKGVQEKKFYLAVLIPSKIFTHIEKLYQKDYPVRPLKNL